jgi:hypothetical protein
VSSFFAHVTGWTKARASAQEKFVRALLSDKAIMKAARRQLKALLQAALRCEGPFCSSLWYQAIIISALEVWNLGMVLLDVNLSCSLTLSDHVFTGLKLKTSLHNLLHWMKRGK